ncbi:uncharacterized protein V1516DRAFT_686181 [Lipomyces oligophaga]|uniref:uncharacterized protein n=1 Tax=Lipomyces oligophaga TaxID=45792 RepID=UPI0034CE54C5
MTDTVLPIVDISSDNSDTVAKQLFEAATTLGFVFIEGSGFSDTEVERMFSLSAEFFSTSLEEKIQFPITYNHGYASLNQEALDVDDDKKKGDPKEIFNFGPFEPSAASVEQPLPPTFASNRSELACFASKCHDVSKKLLDLLSVGLELSDKSWFSCRHDIKKPSGSVLRLLHYPAMKPGETIMDEIRAGAHTDYGSLTLLFQREGQNGLEVLSPITKNWVCVPALGPQKTGVCPPIVVNIADQLSFWTAGLLRSAYHRVRFSSAAAGTGQDRYSMAYFCHPADETALEPVPSAQVEAAKLNGDEDLFEERRNVEIRRTELDGRILTAGEHLMRRLALSY